MFGDQNLQERLKTCSVHAESEHGDEEAKDYIPWCIGRLCDRKKRNWCIVQEVYSILRTKYKKIETQPCDFFLSPV